MTEPVKDLHKHTSFAMTSAPFVEKCNLYDGSATLMGGKSMTRRETGF